jgi:VCBS repeat-containing protein
VGEDVLPSFYPLALGGVGLDPCDGSEETFASASVSLDNDGDGLTDAADPDCAVNTPPVAADDGYTTDEDTPLNVAAPGVLGNDSDADGDPLTAAQVTGPTNGALTLNADGSFDYTPNADFNGSDSFTYVANDGTDDSNVATVTITVNAINDPPVSDPNGPYTGSEGVAVTFDGSGSSDVDGTIVSYDWDFGDGNTGNGVNPTHTYAAAGTYTVSLTVTDDGGATDTASTTATISAVNDPPVAVDDAYATDEDVTLSVAAPGVLANDSDADGDPLTAVLMSGPVNGTLGLNADGSFDYTPNADFNGSDSFTYVANDGQADSNSATVTITVNAINDPPVAVDDAASTPFETPVTIDVLANDVDVDGDSLTVNTFDATSANGGAVSCTTTCAYTPPAGFSGDDMFTYDATDGSLVSNRATVTVSVGTAALVDLDIAKFKVTPKFRFANKQPFKIMLMVKNNGDVDSPRPATVIGVQNGIEIYNETMMVSAPVQDDDEWDDNNMKRNDDDEDDDDERSVFKFPKYTPTASGIIIWTATIADDDPDVDEATTKTMVRVKRGRGRWRAD